MISTAGAPGTASSASAGSGVCLPPKISASATATAARPTAARVAVLVRIGREDYAEAGGRLPHR